MPFPSTLSTFARPNPTDRLNNPSHSALHNTVSSALGQVEAVIGVQGDSSVVGTMMYDLRSPASKGGGHIQGAAFGGTGQSSFNKGDIFVAQSASIISKLAVGTDGYLLAANSAQATGVQWVQPIASALGVSTPVVRVFTASSVAGWTKPSLLSYVLAEVIGGGGGGGGINTANRGAAGGGGGGFSRKKINASVLGLSENVVVGVGGTGSNSGGGSGSAGGTSGFGAGSILYATGGSLGAGGGGGGGFGGNGVNGDINSFGNAGGSASAADAIAAGFGGGSPWGGGVRAGAAGNAYGGGGGGGFGSGASGANGADGVVVITEYYI